MVNTKQICVNQIIDYQGFRYRILKISNDKLLLIRTDCSKSKFRKIKLKTIFEEINKGHVELITENKKVADISSLSETTQKDFKKKKEICEKIMELYGDDLTQLSSNKVKPELEKIIVESGFSKTSVLKLIKKYLQSGFDDFSLISQRGKSQKRNFRVKQGRPSRYDQGIILTEIDYANMDEAIKYYKSHRTAKITHAYDYLIGEFYSPTGLPLPDNQIPTLDQFKYYLYNKLSRKDREIAKTSQREYRNDFRPLISDAVFGVNGPGQIWEADECEWDFSLVSIEDPTKVVGRPIVYCTKDIYTKQITSYSVSFDNNSYVGITNCLMSLLEDKVELCAKLGIEIDENVWPHMILPNVIRTDNGAEYVSEQFTQMMNEIGVRQDTVPRGSGSLKGDIENMFHEIQNKTRHLIEYDGMISKRHDSNHHGQARLNIKQFEIMLILEIVAHNKKYMKNYPTTAHMRISHVKPYPNKLYEYGLKNGYSCKAIANENSFKYALLTRIKVTLSRKGLTYKGLNYFDINNEKLLRDMSNMLDETKVVEYRIDTRDVGQLYTLSNDNEIISIPLNELRTGNAEFAGISLSEYEHYLQEKKNENKLAEKENRDIRIITNKIEANIIASVPKKGVNTKNMRENRRKETELLKKSKKIVPEVAELPEPKKSLVYQNDMRWLEEKRKKKNAK